MLGIGQRNSAADIRSREAFGYYLATSGKLPASALERAERLATECGDPLELVLTRLELIGERDLAEALATYLGLSLVAAKDFPDTPTLEDRLNRKFVRETPHYSSDRRRRQ